MRMTYAAVAGFLGVACVWMVVLVQGLDAGQAPKERAAGAPCRPKELTALTKSRVEESLAGFDEANGRHLSTWSPGFPELKVHHNSSLNGSEVQCSLLFMAQGLERVLEDQKNNLNPTDVSLHKKLRDTISKVNMLAACVKSILGDECSPKPSPPEMPENAFGRKQWGHTLLKTARRYLDWLQRTFVDHISKVKGTKHKHKVTPEKVFRGESIPPAGFNKTISVYDSDRVPLNGSFS